MWSDWLNYVTSICQLHQRKGNVKHKEAITMYFWRHAEAHVQLSPTTNKSSGGVAEGQQSLKPSSFACEVDETGKRKL